MKCTLTRSDFLEAGSKLRFNDSLAHRAWEECLRDFKRRQSKGARGRTGANDFNARVLALCLYRCSRKEDNATTIREICNACGANEKSVWQLIKKKDPYLAAHPLTCEHLFIKYAALFSLSKEERCACQSELARLLPKFSAYSPQTVISLILYKLLQKRSAPPTFSAREITSLVGGSITCVFRLSKMAKCFEKAKAKSFFRAL